MAMQPGPRQVFPANITRISFPSVGGLVFFRVTQKFVGETKYTPPALKALVTGLPWAPFDMFALQDNVQADPQSKLGLVTIKDPVTTDMLSKYLYWRPRPKVHQETFTDIPGTTFDIFVIDTAQWAPVIRHQIGFRQTTIVTREEAIQQYINIFTQEGSIPSLFSANEVGVVVIDARGIEITEQQFIQIAGQAGWTYHYEHPNTPPVKILSSIDTSLVILNLGKLYRDVPNDPTTRKKPLEYKFKVRTPANPHPQSKVTVDWTLEASAWTPTKETKPPKPKQRLSFPVKDVPPSGFMVADFPHPDEGGFASAGLGTSEEEVEVTVTFGVAGVPPKVKLSELTGGSGGGEEG